MSQSRAARPVSHRAPVQLPMPPKFRVEILDWIPLAALLLSIIALITSAALAWSLQHWLDETIETKFNEQRTLDEGQSKSMDDRFAKIDNALQSSQKSLGKVQEEANRRLDSKVAVTKNEIEKIAGRLGKVETEIAQQRNLLKNQPQGTTLTPTDTTPPASTATSTSAVEPTRPQPQINASQRPVPNAPAPPPQ